MIGVIKKVTENIHGLMVEKNGCVLFVVRKQLNYNLRAPFPTYPRKYSTINIITITINTTKSALSIDPTTKNEGASTAINKIAINKITNAASII